MFLKCDTTWVNTDAITRIVVREPRNTLEPRRLQVFLHDQSAPADVADPDEVCAFLSFVDQRARATKQATKNEGSKLPEQPKT